MFFQLVFCQFLLMEQFFLEKLFSRTCILAGKNDVHLTFHDYYIGYVSKNDVF